VAGALILDAEAVNALARARQRGVLAERARAILQVAHEEGALVRVPVPVLAEVCRGGAFDAPVNQLLNGRGIGVVSLTEKAARRAGRLLAPARRMLWTPSSLPRRSNSGSRRLQPETPTT
jgi:hypothetical protein